MIKFDSNCKISVDGNVSLANIPNMIKAGADHLVTIQDTAGGTTLGSFTVMRSTSEVFEKEKNVIDIALADKKKAIEALKAKRRSEHFFHGAIKFPK